MNGKRIFGAIKTVFERHKFVEDFKKASNLKTKIALQIIIAISFLILSVANIFDKSYIMLLLTTTGFVVNAVFSLLAQKYKNGKLASRSCIVTCSVLFAYFVFYGGNNGFSCLWVALLPLMSMVIMDFKAGIFTGCFFQLLLVAVFWTPMNDLLFYKYDEQFCLRFPLFFFVTFVLGIFLSVSLCQAEYNECKHLIELEEMNKKALLLSGIDPLTKLSNRRFVYEKLESNYTEDGNPHCVVMGDIDDFKRINDQYGHEFGDDVLIVVSKYITELLPGDYLKSRWGGEEFLFVANAPMGTVYKAVEELRKAVFAHPFYFNSKTVHVTMTFGIAEYVKNADISKAINLADKRLYIGKSMMKNRTVAQSKDDNPADASPA